MAGSDGTEPLGYQERMQALYEQSLLAAADELSPGLRALRGLYFIDVNVGNGGFLALVYSDPELADTLLDEAIAGAELIGTPAHAEVLRAFVALSETAPKGTALEELLQADDKESAGLHAKLEALDERYFALPEIEAPLARYAERHPAEFDLSSAEVVAAERSVPADSELLARCVDLPEGEAAFESFIDEIAQATRAKLLPRTADDDRLRPMVRAHVLTYLANSEGHRVFREELKASFLEIADIIL